MSEDAFQGIEVPEGDPGALEGAAAGFSAIASQVAVVSTQVGGLPSQAGSWQGAASVAHAAACLSNAGAAQAAAHAMTTVTTAARRYATALHEAQHEARAAIRDARDAQDRIDAAKAAIADARSRAAVASTRIDAAAHALAVSSAAGTPSPAAQQALTAASADAGDAAGDERRAVHRLDEARDDLRRAKTRGHRAMQAARTAAQAAAGAFAAASSMLPRWVTAGPPATGVASAGSAPRQEDHRDWWEKAASWAGGQVVGLGKGAWEGVQGIGSAGAMLYRVSSINYFVDRSSYDRQWAQLGQGAEYAWHHPGDFAEQVVNAEDLEHGRIGEWLGNLAPDAALAFATGGAGVAATRGSRVARVIEKGAEVPTTVRRVGGRVPINARYAGRAFPLPDELATRFPGGVRFRETGFPDFTPYRKADAHAFNLTGDIRRDAAMANKALGLPQTPPGWTWHHVEDGRTLELIPSDLHGAVKHTGGAAVIRHGQVGQIPVVPAPRPATFDWRTAIGTGAGSGAASGLAPALSGAGP